MHLSLCACGHECHWHRACLVQKESWKRIVFLLSFLLKRSRHCRLCCLSHTSLICLLQSSNRAASGFHVNFPLHTQELCLCLRHHTWFCIKHACCAPASRAWFSLRALAHFRTLTSLPNFPAGDLAHVAEFAHVAQICKFGKDARLNRP